MHNTQIYRFMNAMNSVVGLKNFTSLIIKRGIKDEQKMMNENEMLFSPCRVKSSRKQIATLLWGFFNFNTILISIKLNSKMIVHVF